MKVGDTVRRKSTGEVGVIVMDWLKVIGGLKEWPKNNRHGRWRVDFPWPTGHVDMHEGHLELVKEA